MDRKSELADACIELSSFRDRDEAAYAGLLAERATDLLPVDAAGVLLARDNGHLEFAAATTRSIEPLHVIELRFGDGPGLTSFHRREALSVPDLREEEAWHAFRHAALRAGYSAVHVVPLHHQCEVVGSLALYRTAPGPLSRDDRKLAVALNTLAAAGVIANRSLRKAETLADQLQTALRSRIVIEQAKGILAERHGVPIDRAFELMRSFARRDRRKLDDVARGVIEHSPSVAQLVAQAG